MIQIAQFQEAFRLVGVLSEYVVPFHQVNSVVTLRSNYTQSPGANQDLPATRYRVIALAQFTFIDGGITYYQGRLDNFPATCAGYPYSPDTDQLNDPTTPFFYILRNLGNGKILGYDAVSKIHETDCMPEGVTQEYIINNLPTWWNI